MSATPTVLSSSPKLKCMSSIATGTSSSAVFASQRVHECGVSTFALHSRPTQPTLHPQQYHRCLHLPTRQRVLCHANQQPYRTALPPLNFIAKPMISHPHVSSLNTFTAPSGLLSSPNSSKPSTMATSSHSQGYQPPTLPATVQKMPPPPY